MDVEKFIEPSSTYHMLGSDDPYSYAQNSEYQKQLVVSAEDLIFELIDKHLDIQKPSFDPNKIFRIGDFGCSIGPNTFFAVENIIKSVENKYKSNIKNPRIPEYHVFFNDHVDNDFNALFRNIPITRKYFPAGVPGSFHGRLFPNATLHFVHCSTALHWLSRIPKEVTETNSSAFNKGRIHYTGAKKEVKEAYSTQYRKDIKSFLSARAQELVPGGVMVLVILGFPGGVLPSESSIGIGFNILGSCLEDMVQMGKITEEEVDSFNLPFYYPSPSELKALIEENGCFNIERIERLSEPMKNEKLNLNIVIKVCVSHLRAVIGGLIEEHFGNEIVEELFQLHMKKLHENPMMFDEKYRKEANYFMFVKQKSHI
ncbi:S-adenosyl-L-methionine-dependent methyltransferase superfamily protein [Abeliophyllum distichum]|uniref:S-adenosyl-L-methionine-dependent methyltransferase superfamily protein n=1 Tax=Abeliophyllum distichum TaxID=126358 RepID=A0ABD1V4W1_9LAMI